ncbi:hypothetical protein AWB78_06958 [Caballeronia calidae]|uniref:Uncharacterized protein n=1 Tax=Caballeronia calidae TaxID=1777139 RepID=A0A158ECB2_9BURK|nr:hypothetical protein AWB78_06958 [Caballeronia calidae]
MPLPLRALKHLCLPVLVRGGLSVGKRQLHFAQPIFEEALKCACM